MWDLQLPAPWLVSPQILQPWKLEHVLLKLQADEQAQQKQKGLPLGASIACLLFADGASFAMDFPVMVISTLQSAGKWSDPPQRKKCECCFLHTVWAGESKGAAHFRDCGEDPVADTTGQVAMMVRAARSIVLK